MVDSTILVSNELGLHARAAAKLVKTAKEFKSEIVLMNSDRTQEANAKSILSVLALAASCGTELIVKAEGVDEAEAILEVVRLFDDKFGEN